MNFAIIGGSSPRQSVLCCHGSDHIQVVREGTHKLLANGMVVSTLESTDGKHFDICRVLIRLCDLLFLKCWFQCHTFASSFPTNITGLYMES